MTRHLLLKWTRLGLMLLAAVGLCEAVQADTGHSHSDTTTPIKHLVVIYQENVSFDHYFATYPRAAKTDGSLLNMFNLGRDEAAKRLFLDPSTGQPVGDHP